MALEPKADLIVVGGGPAGATLAGLVKKYAPQRTVILLEKASGPRHHVGESLQPGINPILKELGAYDEVVKAGFPRKVGAVYVWGKDRAPWENVFKNANRKALQDADGERQRVVNASFQVRRSIYDEILLRNAERLGVRVVRGASAKSIVEQDGRVVGVVYRDAAGREIESRCEFLADCSGQNGFLSKYRRIREHHPGLKNVASYAYFKNARWKFRYSGLKDETKIFICSTALGWFWYIPIAQDLVSVGFVTGAEKARATGLDPRALYQRELRACAEIWPLLKDAEQMKDFDGSGQDFFVQNDWSYSSVAAAGPGWLACGDAAVFVDPILSSGALLAQLGAQRAAYTLLTQWLEPDPQRLLWKDYDAFCKEFSTRFFSMAVFWYGHDRNTRKWWAKAKEIQRAHLPVKLSDRTAFITVSTGLSQYYEGLHNQDLLRDAVTNLVDLDFYREVLKGDATRDYAKGLPAERLVPRLLYPMTIDDVRLPFYGTGRLYAAKKIRFLKRDSSDPAVDVFNPRRVVSGHHLVFMSGIDGRRTLAELRVLAAQRGVPAHWLESRSLIFIKELALQGVLQVKAKAAPRARKNPGAKGGAGARRARKVLSGRPIPAMARAARAPSARGARPA